MKKYGYFHEKSERWHVAYDNIRYLNHSENPNVTQDEDMNMTALCDISAGSELTQNYDEIFPSRNNEHFKRILNN